MREHTKEPWHVGAGTRVIAANSQRVAVCDSTSVTDGDANARRIVACVNACAGIATEALDGMPLTVGGVINIGAQQQEIAEVKAQRDSLVSSIGDLIAMIQSYENNMPVGYTDPETFDEIIKARALLAEIENVGTP